MIDLEKAKKCKYAQQQGCFGNLCYVWLHGNCPCEDNED